MHILWYVTSTDNTSTFGDYDVIHLIFNLFRFGVGDKTMRYDVPLRRSIAPAAETSQDYTMKNHASNDRALHPSDAQDGRT